MREIRTYGSVRGAARKGRPYRDPAPSLAGTKPAETNSPRGSRTRGGLLSLVRLVTSASRRPRAQTWANVGPTPRRMVFTPHSANQLAKSIRSAVQAPKERTWAGRFGG